MNLTNSNTALEIKAKITTADLQKCCDSFSDPKDCHPVTLNFNRLFISDNGPDQRSTTPGGSIKVAISSRRPTNHHGCEFLCEGIVTEIVTPVAAPISFDETTQKATKLHGIEVGMALQFKINTGDGIGFVSTLFYTTTKNNEEEVEAITLSTPSDVINFDNGRMLQPACMAPQIDESTLFPKPTT